MTWTDLQTALGSEGYVASDDLAVALQLALALGRPLLLEGAAGVGKTEIARALSAVKDTKLIRLQCYEGLDAAQAIYEWNYQRQLLSIRAASEDGVTGKAVEDRIFSRDFLLERPLLAAITQEAPPVLLIDEIGDLHDAINLAGELSGIEGTPRVLETTKPFSFQEFLESTFLGGVRSLAPSRFSAPLLYLWVV